MSNGESRSFLVMGGSCYVPESDVNACIGEIEKLNLRPPASATELILPNGVTREGKNILAALDFGRKALQVVQDLVVVNTRDLSVGGKVEMYGMDSFARRMAYAASEFAVHVIVTERLPQFRGQRKNDIARIMLPGAKEAIALEGDFGRLENAIHD